MMAFCSQDIVRYYAFQSLWLILTPFILLSLEYMIVNGINNYYGSNKWEYKIKGVIRITCLAMLLGFYLWARWSVNKTIPMSEPVIQNMQTTSEYFIKNLTGVTLE